MNLPPDIKIGTGRNDIINNNYRKITRYGRQKEAKKIQRICREDPAS